MIEDMMAAFVDESADEEQIEALQRVISAGQWSLEGSTGRTMMDAIEAGVCVLGPQAAHDYWGNRIPSRYEVQPGTKGSIGYANDRREALGLAELSEDSVLQIEATR